MSLFVLASCSTHFEGSSFTGELDIVDALISRNSSAEALKNLGRLEKRIRSDVDCLSLYKRYDRIGEKKKSEKLLQKSMKKFSGSMDVRAVYVNHLLREKRYSEAYNASLSLADSRYSSFYAESVLRLVFEDSSNIDTLFSKGKFKKKNSGKAHGEPDTDIFQDTRFSAIYRSAYEGSEDPRWIFNSAAVLMKTGDYKGAASMFPDRIASFRESLFWGGLFFDCANYAQSLSALVASEKLSELGSDRTKNSPLKAEILSLASDCYYLENEDKKSEACREKIFAMENGKYATPTVFINSALYSRRNDDYIKEFSKLSSLVEKYPVYEPGLSAYGQFALDLLRLPAEDEYEQDLRNHGLRTLGMEEYDRIPKITLQDAMERIDSAIEGRNDSVTALLVLKEYLLSERQRIFGEDYPVSALWNLLEKFDANEEKNNSELVKYVVANLVEKKYFDDACALFDSYLQTKYGKWPEEGSADFEIWELEYAAWFHAKNNRMDDGIRLYSYIVDSYGDRNGVLGTATKSTSTINSYVNLAVLYESVDRIKPALDMLNKASAYSLDKQTKAEILYRMGKIYWSSGDARNANRTLQYCTSLNPGHNKAFLLLKKIRKDQN